MKIVRESISFERGQDPIEAMNIGAHRKVKKGDRVRIKYKDEEFTVTALDDETEETRNVCVRSGRGDIPPEYESRTCREFDFVDDEGDKCFAETQISWQDGEEYWVVDPDYAKRSEYDYEAPKLTIP